MDAVFNSAIAEVMSEFNIDPEIKNAVISKNGDLGALLNVMLKYENDDFEELVMDLDSLHINMDVFHEIILDSFEYADNVCHLQ
jgi:c-di-GMP-related signal transduction protein